MPPPRWLRALQHRDFRIFWSGQVVSLVGTWMQSVAQSWLVLDLTGSAFLLGVIGALQFGPMLLFSFVAGAAVDRLPKRRVIMLTQSVFLAQALTLAALVWGGHVRYWHVAVLATLFGLTNTLDLPARQAFIVEMVGKESLVNAIALNSAAFNGARIVGPAAAGLLVARYGAAPAFLLNGLSFAAVLVALAAVRAQGVPRPERGTTIGQDIAEGVRYALGSRRIAFVLGLVAAVSIFVFNYNVLVPLFARDVLHADAHGFGLLMAAIGVGALAGALAQAALGTAQPSVTAIVTGAVILTGGMILVGVTRHFWSASIMLFVMGFAGIIFMTSCNTTVQLTSPDELRGRLMSLYTFVFAGVAPVGSLLLGAIVEVLGAPAGFMVGGAIGLTAVLALAAWWRATSGRRA
jgi:MFS family permease